MMDWAEIRDRERERALAGLSAKWIHFAPY